MVDKVVMNRASALDILSLPYFKKIADIEEAMDTTPQSQPEQLNQNSRANIDELIKVQKENNFNERYDKLNILSQDSFGIVYLVNDSKDNFKKF